MVIVSYGGGINSTALLIECVNRGLVVDLILFADTGGEKPHTYKYVDYFNHWLIKNNQPGIITVKKVRMNGEVLTLEQNCLEKNMLPSIAYGYKTCSQKYKIQPQEKFVNNWEPAKREWRLGRKITKFIGYDFDEGHRAKEYESVKYVYIYPLIQWEMGRDECIKTIENAGLCLPGKSACFFCPSSRPTEIRQLKNNYPELAERALVLESNAELTTIKGLGRNFAWRDLLKQNELFDDNYAFTPEMVCECYDG